MKLRGAPHRHNITVMNVKLFYRVRPIAEFCQTDLVKNTSKEDAMAAAKASGLECGIYVDNALVMVYHPFKGFREIL